MSVQSLLKKMQILEKTNRIERKMAVDMLQVTAKRIFDDGKDANNSQIGTYSEGYLKQRRKDGYPNSKKVILQATTQMFNDFSVINTGQTVGLGFKNQKNAEKSKWVEDTYDKKIFYSTKQERIQANEIFSEYVSQLLNG